MNSLAVFTTRFILENKSEVVFVSHDTDGFWQFLGKEMVSEQDARIVRMDEILEIDPTLHEILWIHEGMQAMRSKKGGDWETKKSSES